jgi:hypothetical protein
MSSLNRSTSNLVAGELAQPRSPPPPYVKRNCPSSAWPGALEACPSRRASARSSPLPGLPVGALPLHPACRLSLSSASHIAVRAAWPAIGRAASDDRTKSESTTAAAASFGPSAGAAGSNLLWESCSYPAVCNGSRRIPSANKLGVRRAVSACAESSRNAALFAATSPSRKAEAEALGSLYASERIPASCCTLPESSDLKKVPKKWPTLEMISVAIERRSRRGSFRALGCLT